MWKPRPCAHPSWFGRRHCNGGKDREAPFEFVSVSQFLVVLEDVLYSGRVYLVDSNMFVRS